MARDTGGLVDLSGLEDLRERASYLGRYAWADALQSAMNELAEAAVDHLADDWDKAIEGGPTPFSRVSRKRSSAVRAITRRGATKGVAEAEVRVQDRQSAFLKFALGQEDVREPGDVGVASQANFIPIEDALKSRARIRLTRYGNLPRNALSKLVAQAKATKAGANPQGQDGRGRFQSTERKGAGASGIFYGTVTLGVRPRPGSSVRLAQQRAGGMARFRPSPRSPSRPGRPRRNLQDAGSYAVTTMPDSACSPPARAHPRGLRVI